MAYVRRENGTIVTCCPDFVEGMAEDYIDNNDPELLVFLKPPPAAVPEEISRRQFYQELANRELITKEEALAAIVANTLPAEFAAMVDAILDEDIQWQARMLLAGATEFQRSNWFVGFFAAMKSLSSDYMDDFWRSAALLD